MVQRKCSPKVLRRIADWEARGRYIEVCGKRIFVIDSGNHSGPGLVILHGYPSNSFDYNRVMPLLSPHFRVIIHDHPGFGLSEKPAGYSYSLMEQADTALELWSSLGLKRVHIAAHDYGTSVCTEIIARKNEGAAGMPEIDTVTLSNGSIHIELAKLRFIQKLLRNRITGPIVAQLSSRIVFTRQMKQLWWDQNKVDMDELNTIFYMNFDPAGRKALPAITQYLRERYQYWDRWIGALRQTDLPVHVLWAQEDPVAVKEIGEELHREISHSFHTRLNNVGHYPMLEAPGLWARALIEVIHNQKFDEKSCVDVT